MTTAMACASVARTEKLTWFSTARRDETPAGLKKSWRTKCGRYQVTTFQRVGADFSAWVRDGEFFRLISRHRTQSAAVKVCCAHARLSRSS